MKSRHCALFLLGITLVAPRADAGTLVQFQIFAGVSYYFGEVDVELYDSDKPVTVSNFVHLVEAGYYNQGFFHRLNPSTAGLGVVQGGGFGAYDPFSTNLIGPPYTNVFSISSSPITNEFKVGKIYSNTNGTIAMAKTTDPNSATTQFFFNLTDNSVSLDSTNNSGGFVVFGHTVRGLDVLDQFNSYYNGSNIFNLATDYGTGNPLNTVFSTLPAYFAGAAPPPYDALFLYEINLLTVQATINPTNHTRQLVWATVSGVTNYLDYATNLPPTWQTLTNLSGDGSTVTVTDPVTNNQRRFYRVRVAF